MADRKPYTLEALEKEPVDDTWGTNCTRVVVTKESVAATIDDNARLRALIKAQEWGNGAHSEESCPWCGSVAIGQRWSGLKDPPHKADCPAFTPEGEVR